ncbi:MAG: sensor histidine kinase, partial [Lewinella sp.]|nr:sensor histidine kinase [Lewinella sp.]
MKWRIWQLAIWFFFFYLLFGPLRDLAEDGDFPAAFDFLFSGQALVLFLTTMLAFFTYSLAGYAAWFYAYPRRRIALGVGLSLLAIPVGIVVRYLLQEVIQLAIFGFGNYFEGYPPAAYFWDNFYYAMVFITPGIIFYFVQYAQHQERTQQELILQNQLTQLSLLRSQVNPHFLFNALNNIYALVTERSDQALTAVEKLSSLLRYSLYEKGERVPVSKEWAKVEDFIELERLRYDFSLQLDVQAAAPAMRRKVAPFLFIPFVENAFKHGDLHQPVRISLRETPTELIFSVNNARAEREKDRTG